MTDAQDGQEAQEPAPVPEVRLKDAVVLVERGAVLLDVREPAEWEAGRAPQAVHIPMGEVEARVDELPTDKRIVVVCRSGARSADVTAWLTGRGYDAVNLVGGMQGWATVGFEVVADFGRSGMIV